MTDKELCVPGDTAPTSDTEIGQVIIDTATGYAYTWDGSKWLRLDKDLYAALEQLGRNLAGDGCTEGDVDAAISADERMRRKFRPTDKELCAAILDLCGVPYRDLGYVLDTAWTKAASNCTWRIGFDPGGLLVSASCSLAPKFIFRRGCEVHGWCTPEMPWLSWYDASRNRTVLMNTSATGTVTVAADAESMPRGLSTEE